MWICFFCLETRSRFQVESVNDGNDSSYTTEKKSRFSFTKLAQYSINTIDEER